MLDRETYLEKKNTLTLEEKNTKETLENLDKAESKVLERIEKFLELANNAYLSYKLANPYQERDMVKIITSNLIIEGKKVGIELNYPFKIVENRQKSLNGSPYRDVPRTLDALFGKLFEYFTKEPLHVEFNRTT